MEIKTKFALGDTVIILDRKSFKAAEIEIKSIIVYADGKIEYSEEDSTPIFHGIPEERCFATKDELVEYILTAPKPGMEDTEE